MQTKNTKERKKQKIRRNAKKHLTNPKVHGIITHAFGRLAQLVEHPLDVRKVAGSSPTSSTNGPQGYYAPRGPFFALVFTFSG